MSPDEFINDSIDLGARNGVATLNQVQRLVFLISEAEVYCDMEGIDSFLDRHGEKWLSETAAAFEAVGALEIANGMREITPTTEHDDPLLDRVQTLITKRSGYDYEAIRRVVESRLSTPQV